MSRTVDRRTEALASEQHGVISRAQATALDMTDRMIHRRVADERWVRVHAGVYRLAVAAPTFRQRAMAAALAADGVVSHLSAGRLWSLEGVGTREMHVTVERTRTPVLRGVVVHRAADHIAADVGRVHGIPVTSALRTVLDLAEALSADALEVAIEDAVRRRLFTPGQLEWRAAQRCGRGVAGSTTLRALLGRHLGAADSGWEVRVAQTLVAAGLPEPVRQLRVETGGGPRHIDLGYPGPPTIAIEYDSDRWHSGTERRHADAERRNLLRLAGCLVVEVTPGLVRRPVDLVRTVVAALDVRGVSSNPPGTPFLPEPRPCRTPWVP